MNLFPFCHMTQGRAAHCWHNNLIKTCLHLQQLKQTKLCLETPFVVISMWAFLVGKSHPMLLKGWLWDTGYHISVIRHYPPYLLLFVTIHNHLPLFKTICIIHTICSSLFLTTGNRYLPFRFFRPPYLCKLWVSSKVSSLKLMVLFILITFLFNNVLMTVWRKLTRY